jgi:hypothetical protein
MTNALALQDDFNVENILNDVNHIQKMCKSLMQTKHYAAMGEVAIFAISQKAKSIGLPLLDALNGGIYFVNGKTELASNTMNYLIRAAGHSIVKDPKSDKMICILKGTRKDNGDTWTCSFSIEEAKKAGIYKNTWEKYPEDMLFARALSRLGRQLFPDVIKGMYTEGEIRDGVVDNPRVIAHHQEPTQLQIEHIEPPHTERISADQANELMEILDACDSDYQANVLGFIKKAPHNCNTLYDLPLSLYDRLKTQSLKKKEEAFAERAMAEILANSAASMQEKTAE